MLGRNLVIFEGVEDHVLDFTDMMSLSEPSLILNTDVIEMIHTFEADRVHFLKG